MMDYGVLFNSFDLMVPRIHRSGSPQERSKLAGIFAAYTETFRDTD